MSLSSFQHLFGAVLRNTNKLIGGQIRFFNMNYVNTNFFHSCNVNNARKSNLPVKWKRPEKIPCFHPEKSGDLKSLEKVDLKQFGLEYKDLEELKRFLKYNFIIMINFIYIL